MSLSRTLLSELDHENASTRKLIELVPDARFAWRPHPKSWTVGELAAHLSSLPTWITRILDATEFDLAPILGTRFEVPARWGLADVLARFDSNWESARGAIARASDADLERPWTLKRGSSVLGTMPRIAALRSFVMSHAIHHRGQLTVYLRLLDVPLPGIYGPTADAPL
ncbi:MAG: DinB family protein [Planctomycetota bacterium]